MTSPDDELPIRFHPLSNGEYDPLPRSELIHETVRRTIDTADDNARRLGMDRRRFLRTAAGMATTLTTLAACSAEQRAATTSRGTTPTASSGPSSSTSSVPVGTGGTFELPPESTLEEEAATTVLEARNGDLVIDVQTHLLDYPAGTTSGFGFGFPQASCGVDPAEWLGVDSWLSLVLGGSDTTVAVLSAIPVVADPDPLSAAVMDRARRQAEVAGSLDRVLIQGHATPTLGTLDQAMEAMAATAIEFDIAAWKAYTHEGPAWRLDATVGTAFCNQARTLGQQVSCVH